MRVIFCLSGISPWTIYSFMSCVSLGVVSSSGFNLFNSFRKDLVLEIDPLGLTILLPFPRENIIDDFLDSFLVYPSRCLEDWPMYLVEEVYGMDSEGLLIIWGTRLFLFSLLSIFSWSICRDGCSLSSLMRGESMSFLSS